MIDEPRFKNIQKERDLLSVAHIKKLEEEIDMLRKQKIYLQSKLREKKMIRGDSTDYDLLDKWTKGFDCQGYKTCEIGVREGLGSKIIMDNVINNYIHVGVDPYGNLEYQHYDNTGAYTCDYTDDMRDTMLNDFKPYRNQGKFTLCNMTDTKFMNDTEHRHSTFAFVHFDGPHMTKDVMTEAVWFANRSEKGARFVFDDYPK
jgi:hypothetical protein